MTKKPNISKIIIFNRILKNFSAARNPHVMKNGILEDNINYEKHKYSDEPIIDLSIWTHAYQLNIGLKKILSFTNKI